MSGAAPGSRHNRFPRFDVLAQADQWDPVTTGTVMSRLGMPSDIRFFTPAEQAIGTALCDHLLGQAPEDHATRHTEAGGRRVAILNMIDARLAEKQSDGWRYEDMPHDGQAWRDTLAALDQDAKDRFGSGFAACTTWEQATLIQAVQDLGSEQWHGLCAKHVWSLWTRYACTAFYSHPSAWNEIGFPGPAYPRGYKNRGVDAREPFEVRDARPSDDPARSQR